MKQFLVNLSSFFDKLPDWFKKFCYYTLAMVAMQILLSIQNMAGIDTIVYQIITILIVEVTKYLKNLGVEIKKHE